jgi:hypothetical protein
MWYHLSNDAYTLLLAYTGKLISAMPMQWNYEASVERRGIKRSRALSE